MDKLNAILDVMRQGAAVADPKAWRAGQVKANGIAAFLSSLVALLGAFGIHVPGDSALLAAVAGLLLCIGNIAVTVATEHHLGLPPLGGSAGEVDQAGATADPNQPPGGA